MGKRRNELIGTKHKELVELFLELEQEHEQLGKRLKELRIENAMLEQEKSYRKYFEDRSKELQEIIAEKEAIIKIQSMNNRVLLEEIMRAREGKK